MEFSKALYITEISIDGLKPDKIGPKYFIKIDVRCDNGPYTTVFDEIVSIHNEKLTMELQVKLPKVTAWHHGLQD